MPFCYDIPERQQPATQELASGEEWVLLRLFSYIRANGRLIEVPPAGPTELDCLRKPIWTTDYGSIPKMFQNIFSPTKYGGAYLLHDFLYSIEYQDDRALCDAILLEALKESGANWLTRRVIYGAVRAGGWAVWAKHNKTQVAALREYAMKFASNRQDTL